MGDPFKKSTKTKAGSLKRQPKLANHSQTPQENKGEDSNLKKL